jgi:hypothetical protein
MLAVEVVALIWQTLLASQRARAGSPSLNLTLKRFIVLGTPPCVLGLIATSGSRAFDTVILIQ